MPVPDTTVAKVTADTVTLPLKVTQPEQPKTMQVIVAPGRTLQVGKRQHAPNALVDLPVEEVPDLLTNGFVVIPVPAGAVPVFGQQMPSPTGPTVNGQTGGVIKPS